MKNEKGITLIALIITVIVLLILAGVAISIAINGGDIFGKASTARAEWNIAVEKENKIMREIDGLLDGNNPATPEIAEDPYGGLATAEEIERSKSIFTYEILTSPSSAKIDGTYELGEIADTSDGIKLADNTPRGTAKVTGINWGGIIPGKNPETMPASAFTASDIEVYTNAVKKLVIPAEVRLDDQGVLVENGGNLYTIITFDNLYGDEFYYNNISNKACIPMSRGSYYGTRDDETAETYLIIPSTITYLNNSNIAGRNHVLFAPNSQLTAIDGYSFYGILNLKEIIIPSGVTRIGEHAFEASASLRQVFIPKTVESIGLTAFYNTGCHWMEEEETITLHQQTYVEDCGTYHVTFYYEGTESEWIEKGLGSYAWNCQMYWPNAKMNLQGNDEDIYTKVRCINDSIFATVKFNQTVETMHADTDYIKYGEYYDYSSEYDIPSESEE